jgi:hypothetical protein
VKASKMKKSEGAMCHFSICPPCNPQQKHVQLEQTAMPTDLLILDNDSRFNLFKTEDIQLNLLEDHLSADLRECHYICNWKVQNFN